METVLFEKNNIKYNNLINKNQVQQYCATWYTARKDMITASQCASLLGKCKYQSESSVIIDKLISESNSGNTFTDHGKKYEAVAKLIYETINNSEVTEIGLITHDKYPFLGASPDGITSNKTLDNKPNINVSRLLEIKCPLKRKLIDVPNYYWIQVQIQLACCDVDECDFWQCNIKEFKNVSDWNNYVDEDKEESDNLTHDEGIKVEKVYNKMIKGYIVAFKTSNNKMIYKYPTKLYENIEEWNNWANDIIKSSLYTQSTIIYWIATKCVNNLIKRDDEWFTDNILKLETKWLLIKALKKDETLRNSYIKKHKRIKAPCDTIQSANLFCY